jgi:hypothetical protein
MRSGATALFWKESRESWVHLAIAVVLTASWEGLLAMQQQTQPRPGVPGVAWAAVFWPFLALCAASPALAGEARARTLEFLAGLPVSREWLWRVKATATVLLWALMLALSLLTWMLLRPLLFGSGAPIGRNDRGVPDLLLLSLSSRDALAFGLGFGAALLGTAFLFSALLESVAIAGTLALAVGTVAALGLHRAVPDLVAGKPANWVLLGLLALVTALVASRAAFLAGDLRPGPRKVAAAGRSLLPPAALVAVCALLFLFATRVRATATLAGQAAVPATEAIGLGAVTAGPMLPLSSGRVQYRYTLAGVSFSSTFTWVDHGRRYREDVQLATGERWWCFFDGTAFYSHAPRYGRRVLRWSRGGVPAFTGFPLFSPPSDAGDAIGRGTVLGRTCVVRAHGPGEARDVAYARKVWLWYDLALRIEYPIELPAASGPDQVVATRIESAPALSPVLFQVPPGYRIEELSRPVALAPPAQRTRQNAQRARCIAGDAGPHG